LIVEDVMCHAPVIVGAKNTCREALAIASERAIHFLLAVADDELLGVLQVCELRRAGQRTHVQDCVHPPLITITQRDSVMLARRMLALSDVGCLIVVDAASRLRGTLTREELAHAGLLSTARGVDSCAGCGGVEHLSVARMEQPALCCDCRDNMDMARTWDELTPTVESLE
jgi:CBS-domain-containing membrane protein